MRILNFGSLNIDYVYSVDHFVRSGETEKSNSLKLYCGGKGLNQSIAAAKAGASVYHAGKIGKDGGMLLDALKTAGVNTDYIAAGSGVTGHALIQVDSSGQNCIILHGGENQNIDEKFINDVFSNFSKEDILLLQNEINSLPLIIEKAHEIGMKIAINPSPIDKNLVTYPLDYVTWFILNEIEGYELTGEREPVKIASAILEKYPGSKVVLTLGKNGVLYKDADNQASHGIYNVKRIDTTGAGDTFTGYFLASVSSGQDIEESLRRASVASSISVSRVGASSSIPDINEVLNFVNPQDVI